jgi:hypothetical protein
MTIDALADCPVDCPGARDLSHSPGWLFIEDAGGVRGRLSAPGHAQLDEQRGGEVLDRFLREEHALADLPVRQPFPDELQDPALLAGQRGQRIGLGGPVAQSGHELAGRLGIEHRLAGRHRADRAD